MRVGQGFDTHRLIEGKPLCLGGIRIKYSKGLLGYSDGDAVIHALADALFGAAGLADIGEHFPDTDPAYESITGKALLKETWQMVKSKGYTIANVDVTILAERPRLGKFKKKMAAALAGILGIKTSQVAVKAKTGEGVGPIGTEEVISANAIVLLEEERRGR
jgi:2-C-methyl-D-erythritol 2,4-cyclodiphosphate synthase